MKTFLLRAWQIALPILKAEAIRVAIIKILGSAAVGGFRVWLIKTIVGHFYDEVAEVVFREAGYIYNKVNGKVLLKRLRKAQEEKDVKKIDDIRDDILN